jgi:hypothetical protein
MKPTPEQERELSRFPAALRALVEAELAAGNVVVEIGQGRHPAPPVGAYVLFANKVTTRPRISGSGLDFYERNGSSHSGEFTDAQRYFFVLEPPNPPPAELDMDAIRRALEPKSDPLAQRAQRPAGGSLPGTDPEAGADRGSRRAKSRSDSAAPPFVETESPAGWTRVLYFRDNRPPHEVQFALERELLVLFTAKVEGGRLSMDATADVNGARYDFQVQFLAALKSYNVFALHTVASWADAAPTHHEYHRKSSAGWFGLWTRELISATPPAPGENRMERYQQHCEAAVEAQRHLDSVGKVQQAIVDGLKRGGTYGTSHKEGGSTLYWRVDRFIRSDYGDDPGHRSYATEAEFLPMLWQFCQFEVNRHAGKRGWTELEAWKLILRRMNAAAPSQPGGLPSGGAGGYVAALAAAATLPSGGGGVSMRTLYSTPLAIGLTVVVLGLAVAALAAWQFASIKSTGTPWGAAVRTPTHILQLVSTREPYLPRLHRAPGKDRYRIDLLAISVADPTKTEMFPLQRQQQANAMTPMTKILGADGEVAWVEALELFAVNLKSKRIFREADVRKANPELVVFMHSAKAQFTDRLLVVSPDWGKAYQISSETLKASACPPPSRGSWMEERWGGKIEASLCSGGLISSNEWIALATPEDARSDFRQGFSIPRDYSANEKDRNRQVYRGTADTTQTRPPIQDHRMISETEYRSANFLRSRPGGSIFRGAGPDSVYLVHRTGTELFAPYTLRRLTLDGKPVWSADTGIGRLDQVLPGSDFIAVIGERPPIPDKVPEPILVLVNAATGSTNTVSLWR